MFNRFILFRLLEIAVTLLPAFMGMYKDQRHYWIFPRLQPVSSEIRKKRACSVRKALVRLGTTFIKLGQILSCRQDFIPQEYVDELSKLQDSVPPVSFRKVKKLLNAEFGRDVNTIFEKIEDVSIASASLAQVHIATLHGKKIALKILRPGIEDVIETDLRLLPLVAVIFQIFTQFGRSNTLFNMVTEFSKVIRQELNFNNECANITTFIANFKDNPFIMVPRVYPEYSTRRVIAMEYVQGVKISAISEIRNMGIDDRTIVDILVRCYIKQVLIDGFFHADPHPGNILVTKDKKVAFLDFGMMVRFPKYQQRLIIRASIAGARRDMDTLIQSLTELGILDPEENQQALKKASLRIMQIFDKKDEQNVGFVKLQYMISQFQKVAQDFSISLPAYLVYLFKASGEVESLCMRFMPDFTGISYASPMVKEMAKDLLEEEEKAVVAGVLQKIRDVLMLPYHLQRLLEQVEDERVRVRVHPRQMRELELIAAFNSRRILFGILAGVISITTAILYLKISSTLLLVVGFTVSSILGTGAITMPARLHWEWKKKY